MALVSLVAPEINAEIPIDPNASAVIEVQATLSSSGSNPTDWTLRAASLTLPGNSQIDEQQMTNSSGTQNWTATVNAGVLSTGKPSSNNLLIRVTAEKNAGGSGAAIAEVMAWLEETPSSSSSSSDSSDSLQAMPKAKAKSLVAKAKAAMSKPATKKTAKKPNAPAKKPAPKKPAPPAKKPAKKK